MAFAVILFLFQLCQALTQYIEPSADADDNPDIPAIGPSETWDASAEAFPSLLGMDRCAAICQIQTSILSCVNILRFQQWSAPAAGRTCHRAGDRIS